MANFATVVDFAHTLFAKLLFAVAEHPLWILVIAMLAAARISLWPRQWIIAATYLTVAFNLGWPAFSDLALGVGVTGVVSTIIAPAHRKSAAVLRFGSACYVFMVAAMAPAMHDNLLPIIVFAVVCIIAAKKFKQRAYKMQGYDTWG